MLVAVAILAAIGRRIPVPDPIVFALGGLGLSLIPGIPYVVLSPALVLVVFLPPLIYAAALDTSWAEIRQEAWPILALAVGLVLVTMGVVAALTRLLVPTLPWAAALTLGAIVAPPDAVAAKAIADTLRLPRRLVTILEGEGLVNDAVALVAFQMASGAVVVGTTIALAPTILRLAYAATAAIVVGIAVGWIGRHVLRRVGDPAVENTIALLLPFAAFLLTEAVHASGVLAVLSLALYLSRFSALVASSTSRLQGHVLWEMINFLLTGVAFILVGLQLRALLSGLAVRSVGTLGIASSICLAVILVRPVWVFSVAWLSHSVRHLLVENTLTPAPATIVLTVISWAGMRGVVSLAVALSIPRLTNAGQPFPGRDLIVFVTFVVVLVTLVGQGLTLPALIRRLGVGVRGGLVEDQEISAQLRMARVALQQLDVAASVLRASPDIVERIRGFYADRIERLERRRDIRLTTDAEQANDTRVSVATHQLLGHLLEIEQTELQQLRNDAVIDTPVARRLQRRLDSLRSREHG